MHCLNVAIASLAVGLSALQAQAQPAALHAGVPAGSEAVKVTESGVVRTVNCGGKNLTITGDNDRLHVEGCARINVVGNRNQLVAQLLPESVIDVLGDYNHIIFRHAPGFEVQASSSGTGNEIVPPMQRDAEGGPKPSASINPH